MSPAPKKQQHFIIWLGFQKEGKWQIKDPWTGNNRNNPYKVITFRMFEEKKVLDTMRIVWDRFVRRHLITGTENPDEPITRLEVINLIEKNNKWHNEWMTAKLKELTRTLTK